MKRYSILIALAAVTAAFVLVAADYADARAGRGFSGGSRGNRTFMAPPATKTAPTPAQPIQRSVTQPAAPVAGAAAGAAAAPRAGMFGGGLMGGLAAGFIGAGLFGLLFGSGLFGGMAGFASIIGLLLQVLLIVVVARLAYSWWQRRNAPAAAYSSAANSGPAAGPVTTPPPTQFSGLGGGLGGMFGGGRATPPGQPLEIVEADYDAFEKLLTNIQTAYSADDEPALRPYVTPEMRTYFTEELSANASRGLINKIDDVKLLQGDLAEAWREDDAEYATVAMRFALTDRMVDRNSGATVEGGEPGEATELWTFKREPGGDWQLSAIQQA